MFPKSASHFIKIIGLGRCMKETVSVFIDIVGGYAEMVGVYYVVENCAVDQIIEIKKKKKKKKKKKIKKKK